MEKVQVFDTIFTGDIVISLRQITPHRDVNTIVKVEEKTECGLISKRNKLVYKDIKGKFTSSWSQDEWRLATEQEKNWYLQNPEINNNISNMPKELNYSLF